MAKVIKLEYGAYIAKLSQRELNTIALMLGHSSDELVKEKADDWEIGYNDISLGNELTSLYAHFYSKME